MTKSKEKIYQQMPVLNLHAAGIDVGSREHYVAVGQGKENTLKNLVFIPLICMLSVNGLWETKSPLLRWKVQAAIGKIFL